MFFFSGNRKFAIAMACALIFLLLQMYLNTGTLSAYAVTLQNPFEMEGYIVNYDYVHYECNYHFIMGELVDEWGWGWVLRRELFFVLAYPLFKLYGFYMGGLLSAVIITLVSFYFFVRFIYKRMGVWPAYIGMALLTTYPGIMYWIGSPFAQIMIVPCCCWLYIIMWHMGQTKSLAKHLAYLVIISVLFTAYDLFIFFYPAILLIYLRKRQWIQMILSFPIMVIPQVAITYWLHARGVIELKTENSGLYMGIIQSYLHVGDISAWLKILAEVPGILLHNYFDSNFLFLPLGFLILVVFGYFKKFSLNQIEGSILLMALLVFLFNNMAPAYELGASMRGVWIARIYQPIFIAMIMYLVRFSGTMADRKPLEIRFFIGIVALCVCFNLAINTGGVFKSRLTQWAWYRFYEHAPQETMLENLNRFGVRLVVFPHIGKGPIIQK